MSKLVNKVFVPSSLKKYKRLVIRELINILGLMIFLLFFLITIPSSGGDEFRPEDYILAVEDNSVFENDSVVSEEVKRVVPKVVTGKSIFFTNGGAIRIEKSKNIRIRTGETEGERKEILEKTEDATVETKSEGSKGEKEGESKKTP